MLLNARRKRMRISNRIFGEELENIIEEVMDEIDGVVGSTIGVSGSLVMADKGLRAKPSVSKDGIHALTAIQFNQPAHQMIHELFIEGINKTAAQSGDGRTTSSLIAINLIRQFQTYSDAEINGISREIEEVISRIKSQAKQVESLDDVRKIALVASNNDSEVAESIVDSMDKVGLDGLVTAQLGMTEGINVEVSDGLIFDSGYANPFFATNLEAKLVEYKDPKYFIVGRKLSDYRDLVPAMEIAYKAQKPLVVMAMDYSNEVINFAVDNYVKQGLKVVLVKPYNFGERRLNWLKDMAVSTNSSFVDDVNLSCSQVTINDLGSSDEIKLEAHKTTITNPHMDEEKFKSYKATLQSEYDQEVSSFNKEKLKERIASLSGSMAIIFVGAATETLAKERLARCEDALNSSVSAIKSGYVDGGGAALYRAGITYPLERIVENAGGDLEAIVNIVNEGKGYNILTASEDDSIIDSVTTIENGLKNAIAITKAIVGVKNLLRRSYD